MPEPGLFPLEPAGPDWFGVGLVLSIVGGFLLANSILFRHPRTMVEEHFGGRGQHLTSIREYIFHRVQVHLGFLFLLAGFGLQLFGHHRPPPDGVPPGFPIGWVGAVLLAVVALELVGWWLSHWLFRRYVREYFLRHPPDLETDMALARELGDLFNIPTSGDETIQSYSAEIRRHVGLTRPPRGGTEMAGRQRSLREAADSLLELSGAEAEEEPA